MSLRETFYRARSVAPRLRSALTRRWYQYIASWDRDGLLVFMNYGFESNDTELASLLPAADEVNRTCMALYFHVACAVPLEGQDVLEVGCGRGGGAALVCRHHRPSSFVGLDFAGKTIEFCRRRHEEPGLSYVEGDAEALPFEDGSFDRILNVESAHLYADREAFLRESARVLRAEGRFLLADLCRVEDMGLLRQQIEAAGLQVERETDLAPEVAAALERTDAWKQELIGRKVPSLLRSTFREFAGCRGSAIHRGFVEGSTHYPFFVLKHADGGRKLAGVQTAARG